MKLLETRLARVAAFASLFLVAALSSCASSSSSQFVDPGNLMREKIDEQIARIPYQHQQELLDNMLWLSQVGEGAIPALVQALDSGEPKLRSSAAWCLGHMGDKRVIPYLQKHTNDSNEIVRLEIARSLVLLGDYRQIPALIAGLDSELQDVRYRCFDALQSATGQNFDYDHRISEADDRRSSIDRWQQWWVAQQGQAWFQGSQLAAPQGR